MKSSAFILENGVYHLQFCCGVSIRGAGVFLEINGVREDCLEGAFCAEGAPQSNEFGEFIPTECRKEWEGGLVTVVRFEHDPNLGKLFVSLQIENHSSAPVVLGKCLLLAHPSEIEMGGCADSVRILCRDGWQHHSEVRNLSDDPSNPLFADLNPTALGNQLIDSNRHRSVIAGDMYHPETGLCLDTSFLTFDRANCVIYYSVSGGCAAAECLCDFAGYLLPPGSSQRSETLRLAADTSYDCCMKGWAEDVALYYKPSFIRRAARGALCVWSWKSGRVGDYCFEDLALRNAKAISERLAGFGFEYFWTSLVNLKDQVPGNWLNCDFLQIPDGLAGFAKKLESYGMKLGLWMAPFWIPDRFSNQAEEQKDQILQQDGELVKDQARWLRGISGKYPPEERLNFFCRDGSSPSAQEYIRQVFLAYREAGVRYYMLDFLRAGAGELYGPFAYDGYADPSKIAGPEVYRSLMRVIRETVGPDTYLLSSTGPGFISIGCVDGSRTGPDIGEGRPSLPGYADYPATFSIHNTNMLRNACRNYAAVYHTNGRLFHADSFNVVTVDKPIPLGEAQTTLSLAALFASPMMLGDDVADMAEERLTLLKKALPQNDVAETAIPLDLFERIAPDCPRIYYLPVRRSWGSFGILGLLNLEDTAETHEIDLASLGMEGECALYDFWDERFLGVKQGRIRLQAPPHGVRILRVTPYLAQPQLIGTDMHILQGAVEVLHASYEDNILSVSCTRPAGERGTLRILTPRRFVPSSFDGIHVSRVAGTEWLLISKELNFDSPTASLVLPFLDSEAAAKNKKDAGDERF